ncbi:MAG TPA: chorismate-binding protein, partial [Polyangiales bacterium]|nr:chorismate-binding protein [Polyangiales bacterium]
HEKSPRRFYGGAIGALAFDGSLNTGLILRTIHLADGVARVRAGATLHFDSDAAAEESESELKASALFAVLDSLDIDAPAAPPPSAAGRIAARDRLPVLLIDHRDSFVHTLGDYFRQAGCEVSTLRHGFDPREYDRLRPRLVVLSPGPARPDSFDMRTTLAELARRALPVFGVCLGLQGMVEFCGGRLAQLETPMHGKASTLRIAQAHPIFDGLPRAFQVGRYHSLYADPATFPSSELTPLAHAPDDTLMAIAPRTRPWSAVQFHPESILSADGAHGLRLIANVVRFARDRS